MTRPASPFATPPPRKVKPSRSPQEPSAALRAYIRQRDKGCVVPRIWAHDERLWMATAPACDGPLEIDHVRASGGLGMKSPATKGNLLLLCKHHHKLKTEYGRVWRPLLLAYLERMEVGE